jgi:hypothetical protein
MPSVFDNRWLDERNPLALPTVKIIAIEAYKKALSGSSGANHNDLQNIQGGTEDEYFHLTDGEHSALTEGGATSLHSHQHNDLTNLQGGTTDEYYHSTQEVNGFIRGFVDRTDSVMNFNSTTREFSISPTGDSFSIYYYGEKFVIAETKTLTISNDVGLHFIFFINDELVEYSTFQGFSETFVALIYWNGTDTVGVADERHGIVMDWKTHEYAHSTIGTRYASGLTLAQLVSGNGSLDTHAQTSLTSGVIFDEDIRIGIVRAETPANPFEQELGLDTTIPAEIPILYLTGSTPVWQRRTATTFPVMPYDDVADSRCGYNLDTAGTWTVADPGQTSHIAVWILATDLQENPIIAVLGQRVDVTLANAQDNNRFESLVFASLPFQEFKVLYRLIYQTSTAYGNAIKARLVDIQDLRSISNLPAGTYVATSHSSLSGLANINSHPASAIFVDTTNFDKILSSLDSNVQLALETLDEALVKKDGTISFTGTIGGIDPVSDSDLATKKYVDEQVAAAGGGVCIINYDVPELCTLGDVVNYSPI